MLGAGGAALALGSGAIVRALSFAAPVLGGCNEALFVAHENASSRRRR